jgi:hypothetical protein
MNPHATRKVDYMNIVILVRFGNIERLITELRRVPESGRVTYQG